MTEQSFIKGHWPKPIILAAGLIDSPIVPSVMPLQLIQIGELVVTAVPGELTTMAGRRLRETLLSEFEEVGVRHVALATYANDYSLYITTKEEYERQHYEGAATLYGPYTLAAYQQEFSKLAKAIARDVPADAGLASSVRVVPISNRITIRNLMAKAVKVEIFRYGSGLSRLSAKVLIVPAQSDRAYFLSKHTSEMIVVIDNLQMLKPVRRHHLITVNRNGYGQLSNYIMRET